MTMEYPDWFTMTLRHSDWSMMTPPQLPETTARESGHIISGTEWEQLDRHTNRLRTAMSKRSASSNEIYGDDMPLNFMEPRPKSSRLQEPTIHLANELIDLQGMASATPIDELNKFSKSAATSDSTPEEPQPSQFPDIHFKWVREPKHHYPEGTSTVTQTVKPSIPNQTGSQIRVQQTYVLNYKPRVEATISLNGNQPEVRFSSPDEAFYLSGDELLEFTNRRADWATSPVFLAEVRLEPIQDGLSFTRFQKDHSYGFLPISTFEMSKYAGRRFISKLNVMGAHIVKQQHGQSKSDTMFDCVIQVYKK